MKSADPFKQELGLRQNLPLVAVALVGLALVLAGAWLLFQTGDSLPERLPEVPSDR